MNQTHFLISNFWEPYTYTQLLNTRSKGSFSEKRVLWFSSSHNNVFSSQKPQEGLLLLVFQFRHFPRQFSHSPEVPSSHSPSHRWGTGHIYGTWGKISGNLIENSHKIGKKEKKKRKFEKSQQNRKNRKIEKKNRKIAKKSNIKKSKKNFVHHLSSELPLEERWYG